jgi:SAM-dependent methyltransferase
MLKQLRRSAESGTALWEDHWRRFDAIRYDPAALRWDGILDLIDRRVPSGRLLEAGCGLGRYLLYVGARGGDPIGIDFALEPLKRITSHEPRARVAAADLSRLPFPPETFETILCFGVLEHFEQGAAGQTAELAALLRPSGWLIVTVPYANFLKRRRAAAGGSDVVSSVDALPPGMGFYQHCFTRAEARNIVHGAGLNVIEERRISRLFWLLGGRSGGPRRPGAGPSASAGQVVRRGRGSILRSLAREAAYWAQWAIPPDLTSHMIAIVGQKPPSIPKAGTSP